MNDVLMRVTAVDYEEADDGTKTVVQVAGRDEFGNRRTINVDGTLPHLYIPENRPNPTGSEIVSCQDGYESYDDRRLTRVETRVPSDISDITDEYEETWESDIPYYRRATMDYGLVGHIRVPDADRCRIENIETNVNVSGDEQIEPRILIGDIEVIHSGGSIEEMKDKAEDTVCMVTMWDSKEDEYHCLMIDPDGDAQGAEVKSELELHAGAESLSNELERPIHLQRHETEEDLLEGLLELFEAKRPDLVSGWNFVDFDWEYLLSRYEKFDDLNEHRLSDIGYINGYKTAQKVDCVPAFDMMTARTTAPYSFSSWRSQSLDYVAKVDLGVGKIPDVDIQWAFSRDLPRLVAYNIMDVMLCVGIERRENLHAFFYDLAELAQIQMYDTSHEMRLVDGRLLSQRDDDEVLPPMPEDADIPDNSGGLVLQPSDGIKEWVGVEDLKSLYPSAIITWNISPETIVWADDGEKPEDAMTIPWMPDKSGREGISASDIGHDTMWTDMAEEGIIPKYIKELFPERAELKAKRNKFDPDDHEYHVWDRKQAAVKVLMNSFYGVMSNDWWRLGKYGLGDAVTSTARYALWKGKQTAENNGFDVIYGDTDSVMISLAEPGESKEVALDRGRELEDEINASMVDCVRESGLSGSHPFIDDGLHGTDAHCLVYEFEKLYRRFFQAGQKKRYAGNIVWKEGKHVDGDIDTVGFESQRSDSPELTSEAQPEVIRRILNGEGFEEVSEYIQEMIDDIKSGVIDLYRVGLPGVVNKPLGEYGNTQTARACRFSNNHLEKQWTQGDDPWVYFVETTPPMVPDTDVVALDWSDELPDGYALNYDEMLRRSLKGPLRPILEEMNWKFTELKEGAKTESAASDGWASGDWDTGGDDNDNGTTW